MVIIVEGMDGSGKSVLVSYLADTLGAEKRKAPVTEFLKSDFGPRLLEWTKAQLEHMQTDNLNSRFVVYDRFPLISEPIYGPILRGRNAFGALYWPLRERFFGLAPLLIYCRPPRGTIYEYLAQSKDGHLKGVFDKKHRILATYDRLFEELRASGIQFRVYDHTSMHPDELVNWIHQQESTKVNRSQKINRNQQNSTGGY